MGANSSWIPIAQPAPARFRRERRPEERVTVLGARMDLVKPEEVFHFVARRIAAGQPAIVANHNLQSLALCRKDPELSAFFERADLVEVDSIPLIAWARLLGHPARRFHRCTYLDWRDAFWSRAAEEGWRVFLLGGRQPVVARAAGRIAARHRGVALAARSGWFDATEGSAENEAAIEAIKRFRPDVLLVGMGMPRQELWVQRNLDRLPPCAVFTVGGAFDYEAGAQVPCPRWIGRIGLEWLFRLVQNPPRLFRRYCVEPFGLLPLAWRDLADLLAKQAFSPQRLKD
jgi:N-acetylglucosaminyldiphosphoundecaprenol N-acetyl-beta-D-mannosaminyltransferase